MHFLEVFLNSWASRSWTKSSSVLVIETLTSLWMSAEWGAELMTRPLVTKLELSSFTTEKSMSLKDFMQWNRFFICHLYLNLLISPLSIIFLSVRIPPYFSRTKIFQYSFAVASDTPFLLRMLSSFGSLLITNLSLDWRSRDLSKINVTEYQ